MNNIYRALLVSLLASTFQARAAEPPIVGVVLPLTGQFAIYGSEALNEIESRLGKVATLVKYDDNSNSTTALVNVARLAEQGNVKVVIGLWNQRGVDELLKLDVRIPVLTLAQATNSEMLNRAQGRSIFMFAQPSTQINAIAKALPADKKFLVSEFSAFSGKVDAISGALGSRATKAQPFNANTFPELLKSAEQQNATLAAIADPQVVGDSIAQYGNLNSNARVVLISPPTLKQSAAVAANVVAEWIAKNNLTADGLRDAIARSRYYDKDQKTLAIGWSVATVRTNLIASVSTTDTTCSCTSKNGRVTHSTPCKTPPEKCDPSATETDCTCECK